LAKLAISQKGGSKPWGAKFLGITILPSSDELGLKARKLPDCQIYQILTQ
jgi:hypothetical protein